MDNQDSFVDYVKMLTASEIQKELDYLQRVLGSDGIPSQQNCEEIQILRRALTTRSRSY